MTHVLHHGDCLDPTTGLVTLADASVDHCIQDPPYDEHTHTKGRRGHIGHEEGTGRATFNRKRELGFDAITPEQMQAVAVQCARVVRRWTVTFCSLEMISAWRAAYEAAGLEYIRTGVWVKLGAAPSFVGDRPAAAAEAIVFVHPKGRKRWNGGGGHAVWRDVWEVPIVLNRGASGEQRVHTCQKPATLIEALIRDFTDPGEKVLDPFAGSGTTLAMCKRLGRNSVGWERDERYHRLAEDRIAGTDEQLELGSAKASKWKQGGMFDDSGRVGVRGVGGASASRPVSVGERKTEDVPSADSVSQPTATPSALTNEDDTA